MANEVILYMMAKSKHPDIRRYISLYFTQLKNVRPLVTGKDLLDLGYPPGPEFKRIFDEVLERKFTGELKTKAAEMSFVLSHFPKKAGGNA
jgi:tRNA nucleotidyltransferase (CCA-adding enzyme)